MIRHVLDTDILSLLQLNHPTVATRVLQYPSEELAVTIISVEEQVRSWFTLCRRAKGRAELAYAYERFTWATASYAPFSILTLTESAIDRFTDLKRLKLGVKANDLRIAAIALENSTIVVTRNRVDFSRVPGLTIADWSA